RSGDVSGTGDTAIGGATGASHTPTPADAHTFLRVAVTANDGRGGSETARSPYLQVSNSAPANTGLPGIAGVPGPLLPLHADKGSWHDADGDTFIPQFQWYRADDASGSGLVALTTPSP